MVGKEEEREPLTFRTVLERVPPGGGIRDGPGGAASGVGVSRPRGLGGAGLGFSGERLGVRVRGKGLMALCTLVFYLEENFSCLLSSRRDFGLWLLHIWCQCLVH